jgi:acetyl/propionyl-CoA carboxylase alpha subunit
VPDQTAAGGGGIGMKVVVTPPTCRGARRGRAKRKASFGNDALYIERLIEQPRHVEIQVFADHHGHTVHVFERECSAQRRHQKVIEESPVSGAQRRDPRAHGRRGHRRGQGRRLSQRRDVRVPARRQRRRASFYFLEMNTRLQVEHPVTECVTGVDLVHAQLRVASVSRLPFTQAGLSQRGHAIECRIYAEDPRRVHPAGRHDPALQRAARTGIRVDSGVKAGPRCRFITTRCWPS